MSDQAKHTCGSLQAGLDLPEVSNNNPDPRLIWSGSRLVADCRTSWASEERAAADARRLAACWNACSGIPTDALKPGVLSALIENIRELNDASVEGDAAFYRAQQASAELLDRLKAID